MDESQTIRVSVEEAAFLLGIEKGSVKKRIQRGKLHSEKDARGITWVYLARSETVRDQSQGRSETDRNELVGELRDRIAYLERQVGVQRSFNFLSLIAPVEVTEAAASVRDREPGAPGRFWKAARKDLGKWPSQGRGHPSQRSFLMFVLAPYHAVCT
jgi:hypothetical protein